MPISGSLSSSGRFLTVGVSLVFPKPGVSVARVGIVSLRLYKVGKICLVSQLFLCLELSFLMFCFSIDFVR